MEENLMTTSGVATYLGVPESTLYQWRYRGTAPRAIRVGKHTRYRRADVDEWVEAHVSPPRDAA
jgi:excisionase family DNA binding protein